MKVICETVGAFQTNCYIVYNETTLEAFIVDPGDSSSLIIKIIKENKLNITHIILTHGHFDHIAALSAVAKATGAVIAIHEKDAEELINPNSKVYSLLGLPELHITPSKPDILLHDGDNFICGSDKFTILSTPGHTNGSICIYNNELLFTGDTLFAGSCGRTDLPGGNENEILHSLKRLAELPGDRIVYPGHGPASTLDGERRYNRIMLMAQRKTYED